jgi:hypothetical protein
MLADDLLGGVALDPLAAEFQLVMLPFGSSM